MKPLQNNMKPLQNGSKQYEAASNQMKLLQNNMKPLQNNMKPLQNRKQCPNAKYIQLVKQYWHTAKLADQVNQTEVRDCAPSQKKQTDQAINKT